jgi:hypothetical protein
MKFSPTSDGTLAIAADLLVEGVTRVTFTTAFPLLFEKHYGRAFDMQNDHDLMLAEVAFSEAFGWLGNDGKVYR